jgi:hypothetical protein
LRLRQESSSGAKFQLKKRSVEALDRKLPKYTAESLAKKKAATTEAKKKNTTQGLCLLFQKMLFGKNYKTKSSRRPRTNKYPSLKIHNEYMYPLSHKKTLLMLLLTAFMLWPLINGQLLASFFKGAYLPQKLTPKSSIETE